MINLKVGCPKDDEWFQKFHNLVFKLRTVLDILFCSLFPKMSIERMHQSIPSTDIPPSKPPGNFLEVVRIPAPGQNCSAKGTAPRTKRPSPREYFRKSNQPFLLIGIENFGILQKSNWLEKNWKAVQLFFGHTL